MAGVVGPILVTQLRQVQIDAGVERRNVYDHTMYILALLLLGGLICNLLIRPVRPGLFMRSEVPAGSFAEAPTASAGRSTLGGGAAVGLGLLRHAHEGCCAVPLSYSAAAGETSSAAGKATQT